MKSSAGVPYFPNQPDDLHCSQASFRMILKYFLPDRNFSWEELDRMSATVKGKATWPSQMLINLQDMGFDVVLVEGCDAEAFIAEGADYLQREFGPETAEWQIKNSDIPQEQRLYQKMLDSDIRYEHRIPDIADIAQYLEEGYLVKVTVNSKRLNQKPGYSGHSVVVYQIDDQNVTFHDPGLPGKEARLETIADFQAAWADPNDKAKELIAVKYKEI